MLLPCLHPMKPTFFFFATSAIKLYNKFKKNSKRSRINVRSVPIRVLLFLNLEKNWKIQWLSVHQQPIHQVTLCQFALLIILRKSKSMQCYSILHQIVQTKVDNFSFQSDIRGHPHMMWPHWCHGKIEFFSNPHPHAMFCSLETSQKFNTALRIVDPLPIILMDFLQQPWATCSRLSFLERPFWRLWKISISQKSRLNL